MRLATEIGVLATTVFLVVMGQWLAALLWQGGYVIGFHRGRAQ